MIIRSFFTWRTMLPIGRYMPKDKDLEKFASKYDKGWEAVREERYRKMVELGIVNPDWKLAEWESRAWNELYGSRT